MKYLGKILIFLILISSALACEKIHQTLEGTGKNQNEATIDLERKIERVKNKEGFRAGVRGGEKRGNTYYKWQDVEYCR